MGLFGRKKHTNNPDEDFFDFNDNTAADPFFNNDSGDSLMPDDNGFDFDDSTNKKRKKRKNPGRAVLGILIPILIGIVIIGAIYFAYSSVTGPRRSECTELLNDFEKACNKLDMNDMAECLEPSLCNKIKAAILVTTVITKQDINDLLGLAIEAIGSGFIPDTGDTTLEISDILKTISIDPVRYGFPGRTRVVKCKVSIAGITEYVNFTIKKENGDVYIAKAGLTKK